MTDPTTSDRRNPVMVATIAIAAAVALYIIVVLLQSYYQSSVAAEAERKVIDQRSGDRIELDAKHIDQLSGYRRVDPEVPDRVSLPIERAMELVVTEFSAAAPGQPATLVPALTPAHDQATAPALADRATGAATAEAR